MVTKEYNVTGKMYEALYKSFKKCMITIEGYNITIRRPLYVFEINDMKYKTNNKK